ncbi:RidA family protein [Acididesulfobacillus acetoxydans]|uniref:RidA family protein n=1 Tax=Acididesulfobacillus acetoxydans TaxID=1561005 RepID=UPI001F0D426F|nr:RidA family protein [Acididesulfobacillus acetoxydans]
MERKSIQTTKAPAAIGPYSQAIAAGSFVFVSGQMGLKPDGEMAGSGVEEQASQALKNLKAILEEAGSSLANVVKTTVFLADMQDFAVVNAIYAQSFPGGPPARSAVQVARLPKDAKVEIEAIAMLEV